MEIQTLLAFFTEFFVRPKIFKFIILKTMISQLKTFDNL